ncbi:redoxin domain-containing protein [Altibacter lentus]|uniref:redoxin domain-containing protein n=1 Tax=Altibacter lentus TaxID=1223410 RepID=UPI00054D05AE|nr:redoxin domain-containing protein [Altibacter lentus]
MTYIAKCICIIVFCLCWTGCKDVPEPVADSRVNDYALYDVSGDLHRFSYYNDHKAIVLWVQGNGCPIVRNALTDFHEVASEYSQKGFVFFMLNSNPQDDRSEIQKEALQFNFEVPVLKDPAQLIADALDITLTAEAIVLHPTTREILYRGPINDRLDYEVQKQTASNDFLKQALDRILKGKKPTQKEAMTRGCTVTRLSTLHDETQLTYTKDIAPILKERCAVCHIDGGIAPWQMTDYRTIQGWSQMMKQVLLSKRMPPWKADPHIGTFENSLALSDSNARKIVAWIDNGLAYGEGDDPLQELSPITKEWKRGIPDAVIELKTELLPATGVLDYRYQSIPLNNDTAKWLRGIEIQPGNNQVVHHVVVTNTERNKESLITHRKQRPWTDNYIAISSQGAQATFFPEGTGVLLPEQTELTLQIHYTTTGKTEEDKTRIGLYYHETPPGKEFYALSPSKNNFTIPPYAQKVPLRVEDSIHRDINIHYIAPHMHYRGKSIRFGVTFPDGRKETVISISDYNFNWQRMYRLETPFFVPKGSKVWVEGIYDNSFQNPFNPDPSQEIGFGLQSTDEMLIGFFNYTIED